MLCADIHHYVDCRDSLGIKMLGAYLASACTVAQEMLAAQKMLAACIPGDKCQPAPTGQR
jgi:hypothetical protein